jgi:hypothetical protein
MAFPHFSSVHWNVAPSVIRGEANAEYVVGTIAEIAAAEKINVSYVGRVLWLPLLAPDIVEAILNGRQPAALQLPTLLKPLPIDWESQRILVATS